MFYYSLESPYPSLYELMYVRLQMLVCRIQLRFNYWKVNGSRRILDTLVIREYFNDSFCNSSTASKTGQGILCHRTAGKFPPVTCLEPML